MDNRLTRQLEAANFFQVKEITHLSHKEMMPFYRRMQIIFQDNSSAFNPRKTIGQQIIDPILRFGFADSRLEAESQGIARARRMKYV